MAPTIAVLMGDKIEVCCIRIDHRSGDDIRMWDLAIRGILVAATVVTTSHSQRVGDVLVLTLILPAAK